jgi:hypothetical protein
MLAMTSLVDFPVHADEAKPTYALLAVKDHASSVMDQGSPGFDSVNTAYIRSGGTIFVAKDGRQISQIDLNAAAHTAIDRDIFKKPGAWDGQWDRSFLVDTAIVFDDQDRAYTIIVPRASNLQHAVLLWSGDHGKSWSALPLAGRDATLEKPDAFNDHARPPTVLSNEYYGARGGGRLWLETFAVRGNAVGHDGFQLLSNRNLLSENHSGAGNSSFTTKTKIFVVYATTDKSGYKWGRGTLSVARQYDRASHKLEGEEVPIGRSTTLKGPDPHDIPAITGDAAGQLTVVIGAHHAMLQTVQSREPGSVLSGFTDPQPIGNPNRPQDSSFSYESLDMSRDGTLNMISRAEGDSTLYQLVQFRRPAGSDWTVWPNRYHYRVIARPNRPSYVAWRQRVTVDRNGVLYLHLRYYLNSLTADEAKSIGVAGTPTQSCDARGRCWYVNSPDLQPDTLVSRDDGLTWH